MAHEDFDEPIEELSQDHEEAEQAMLAAILAYLSGTYTIQQAISALATIAEALATAALDWIEDVMPTIYEDGAREAREALGAPETAELGSEHQELLEISQTLLQRDMEGVSETMVRDAVNALDEIRRRNIEAMLAGGRNAIPQAREMADEMRERGIRFTDRSGRRWQPRSYATMLLRTAAVDTSNTANLTTAASLGSPGVRVRDGGPGDVDEPCKVANGQRWSTAYALAHKLEHPQCRRAFSPLPSTYTGKLDRE